ncbi:IclR family transcriptional regulator [Bradyrhizobium cenepequi]
MQRAISLLRLIASSNTRDLRLVDLAEGSGLNKSTAHRLLQCLLEERMLTRSRNGRGYRLGPLLYEFGLAALPAKSIKEIAHPHLCGVAEMTGDMTFLVARSGFETVCLDAIAGHFHVQTMTSGVGDRHPLGIGAGGQAILAALADSEIELVFEATRHQLRNYTQFSRQSILNDVARCRRRGYSLDENMAADGISAMGKVICVPGRIPVAAVFIATLSSRMQQTRRSKLARHLETCATAIERDVL